MCSYPVLDSEQGDGKEDFTLTPLTDSVKVIFYLWLLRGIIDNVNWRWN